MRLTASLLLALGLVGCGGAHSGAGHGCRVTGMMRQAQAEAAAEEALGTSLRADELESPREARRAQRP